MTISLKDASVVDQFQFPGGAGGNLGTAGVPATVSFDITYTKSGKPRDVHPTSNDPLSPFNWEGEMWGATNAGTFSLAYNDGSFSANGSFSSMGNFGEMGTERNGSFVRDRDEVNVREPMVVQSVQNQSSSTATQWATSNSQAENSPKWKGRVPLRLLIH